MGTIVRRQPTESERARYVQVRHLLPNGLLAPVEELSEGPTPQGEPDRYRAAGGDVLLACRGGALRSALVNEASADIFVANNLIRVRIHEPATICPEVFLSWFRSPFVQTPLLAMVTGPIGIHLRAKDVEAFEVPVMPADLQAEIASLYHAEHRAYVAALEVAEQRRSYARAAAEQQIFGGTA